MLERRLNRSNVKIYNEEPNESLTKAMADMSISEPSFSSGISQKYVPLQSSSFWTLVPRLIKSLLHLSRLFTHAGLFLDAEYYLEEAMKIVRWVHAPRLLSQCQLARAQHLLLLRDTDSCREELREFAKSIDDSSLDPTLTSIMLQSVEVHAALGDVGLAASVMSNASEAIDRQKDQDCLDHLGLRRKSVTMLADSLATLSVKEPLSTVKTGKVVKTKDRLTRPNQLKKFPQPTTSNFDPQDHKLKATLSLSCFASQIKYQKAAIEKCSGNLSAAKGVLDLIKSGSPNGPREVSEEALSIEIEMLLDLQELTSHPLFNVVPESTICYPSVNMPKQSTDIKSPVRKTVRGGKPGTSKASTEKAPSRAVPSIVNHAVSLEAVQEPISSILYQALRLLSTKQLNHLLQVFVKTQLISTILPSTPIPRSISPFYLAFTAGK